MAGKDWFRWCPEARHAQRARYNPATDGPVRPALPEHIVAPSPYDAAWLQLAWLPLAGVLAWCLRTAPWRRLAAPEQLHVFLGTVVGLCVIWSIHAVVRPGMDVHLIGATLVTLMFGRQLAIIGLGLALLGVSLSAAVHGATPWAGLGLEALLRVVAPVFLAWGIQRAVERWLPPHFFVYIFVASFFGAALSSGCAGALLSLAAEAGSAGASWPAGDFLLSQVLLGFAEAWLTGAVITLMVVYRPHWVASFDARRYLWSR